MKYNFDEIVNRRNTSSLKWDVLDNELPMWVADMDFPTCKEVQEEIQKIDETAFIVIVPASTVMGRGFSLQKDYQRVPNDFINPL